MWREYTKETPARAGWGVVTTAIALAGTTGLAYFVTGAKAAPAAALTARINLPGWPFSFALPHGFRLVLPEGRMAQVVSDELTSGYIEGARMGARGEVAVLSVRFKVHDRELDLRKAFARWSRLDAADAGAVKVGSLDGLAAASPQPEGHVKFIAVAVIPDGLVIVIELETASASPRARRQFEAVCESVHFKDWHGRVGESDPWIE
jgi:hypothetical protein